MIERLTDRDDVPALDRHSQVAPLLIAGYTVSATRTGYTARHRRTGRVVTATTAQELREKTGCLNRRELITKAEREAREAFERGAAAKTEQDALVQMARLEVAQADLKRAVQMAH